MFAVGQVAGQDQGRVDHVIWGGGDAQAGQLLGVSLPPLQRLVGEKDHATAPPPQLGDRLRGTRDSLLSPIDGPIQVGDITTISHHPTSQRPEGKPEPQAQQRDRQQAIGPSKAYRLPPSHRGLEGAGSGSVDHIVAVPQGIGDDGDQKQL